jgi:endonuclease G
MNRRHLALFGAGGGLALALGWAALAQSPPPPVTPPAGAPPPAGPAAGAPPPVTGSVGQATTPIPTTGESQTCPQADLAPFKTMGVPYHRSEDANAQQAPMICRPTYALSFNTATGSPDWVIERLTKARLVGSAKRANNFRPDPLLAGSPTASDYTRTGYDRGHQAPAGDAKFSQAAMDDSFYMSNMSPQVGIGFNRGQWKILEETVRAWVICGGHDDIVVMTGPIYGAATKRVGPKNLLVPEAYYKIVYDVKSERVVGFILPNQALKRADLDTFAVPISEIEDKTGLDFFRGFTRRRQNVLETSAGTAWGHDTACSDADTDD